jgi:signal transduction histidine kinase
LRNYTILIVDDKESNIIALKELLRHVKNIDLIEATSGKDALKTLLERAIDLVLLDIQMPNMDGFEVATYMKKIESTKSIPIIFLTAFFTQEEFIKQGYKIGAIDYILKPIDEAQLINKISLYTKLYYREKSLEEAQSELKIMFENIDIAVGLFAINGSLKKSNSKFNELECRDRVFKLLLVEPYQDYSKIIEIDNFSFDIKVNFIFDKRSNEAQYVLILLKDITQKLREERERLEQDEYINQQSKFIAMGEVIAMIAHQWRQPLNSINSSVVNLKMKYLLDSIGKDDIIENLDFIENKVNNLSKVITDFLNFSKQQVIKEMFSINESLDAILKIFDSRLKKELIDVRVNLDSVSICGNRGLIEQVFINLFTNSIEAFESSSNIDSRVIEISSYQERDYTHILFSDNAGGVDKEIVEKLCNPYFTTKDSGTGLGLYMVKRILQRAFSGDLFLESNIDGLRIDISLLNRDSV